MHPNHSYLTVTDQFCGCGGSSIGAQEAGAVIILAMNHWKLAIDTHSSNFQNTTHVCTDISATDPRRYPPSDILITSPECTNHSVAKGRKRQYYKKDLFGNILIDPAEERSRATMWDVPRFAEWHNYNMIIVENVADAGQWILFDSWLHAMHAMGYEHEVVYFNSMFAWPTPQSRDRMYTIFWKKGNKKPDLDIRPKAWCEHCGQNIEAIQTWKQARHWGKYGRQNVPGKQRGKGQYYYRCPICAKEVVPYYFAAINALDLTIPATRIGDRAKPLKPKTLARVQYGWEKFGQDPMILTTRYTSGTDCRVHDALFDVVPTQPGDASHAVVAPWIVDLAHSQKRDMSYSGMEPMPTQTTAQSLGVVYPWLVETEHSDGENRAIGPYEPTPTQTGQQSLAVAGYMLDMHGTGHAYPLSNPMGTVSAGGIHQALVTPSAFLTYYYGTMESSDVLEAAGTVTTKSRAALVGEANAMRLEDLTFRMCVTSEIKKIMAFRNNYIILGTEKEKVKQLGNAVTPPAMTMLFERCAATFR